MLNNIPISQEKYTMHAELNKVVELITKAVNLQMTNLENDKECAEYFGFNFKLGHLNCKFRKAKITPKKVGQFVTLWRRNGENKTEPFHENDSFNFYIIATYQKESCGFFIFPKTLLVDKHILTNQKKEGKRGFRVYPQWTITTNKQAQTTQKWQIDYFIDCKNDEKENSIKINTIINN